MSGRSTTSLALDIARSEAAMCKHMVAYRTGPPADRMAEWRRFTEVQSLNLALVARLDTLERGAA